MITLPQPTNKTSKKTNPSYFVDAGTANNGQYGNQKSVICGTDKEGNILFFEEVGDKTINEAELLAIKKILEITSGDIAIKSDSNLAVKLVQHEYTTKIERLRTIVKEIQDLSKERIFLVKWISRDFNKAGWIIEQRLGL